MQIFTANTAVRASETGTSQSVPPVPGVTQQVATSVESSVISRSLIRDILSVQTDKYRGGCKGPVGQA